MTERQGFWSWWTGELREVVSSRPLPTHVLALSDREIALLERGTDEPLGVVAIDAPDRMERIEGLRALIAPRRRDPVVEVQLPAEQVMFARVELPAGTARTPAAFRAAIAEALGPLTGQPAEALVFDAIRSGADEAVVGATLASTVEEAVRYAREWGFEPARISSIEAPRAFRRGPDFTGAAAGRSGASLLPKLTAAAACVALLMGAAAAARVLVLRADTAAALEAEAAALPPGPAGLEARELALAATSHAGAIAVEERTRSLPTWRLLAELSETLPPDVTLDALRYEAGQLRLTGSAGSIERLSDALDAAPMFSAPFFPETAARRAGTARFVLEATVDERSVR